MTDEEKDKLINQRIAETQHCLIATILPITDLVFGYVRDLESVFIRQGVYKHKFKAVFRHAQNNIFKSLPHMGDGWETDVFSDILDNTEEGMLNEVKKLEISIKSILDKENVSNSEFYAHLEAIGILLSVAQHIFNQYNKELLSYSCRIVKAGYEHITFTGLQEQKIRKTCSERVCPKIKEFNPRKNLDAWGEVLDYIEGYSQELHSLVDNHPTIAAFRNSLALLALNAERVERIYQEAIDNNPRIEQEYSDLKS